MTLEDCAGKGSAGGLVDDATGKRRGQRHPEEAGHRHRAPGRCISRGHDRAPGFPHLVTGPGMRPAPNSSEKPGRGVETRVDGRVRSPLASNSLSATDSATGKEKGGKGNQKTNHLNSAPENWPQNNTSLGPKPRDCLTHMCPRQLGATRPPMQGCVQTGSALAFPPFVHPPSAGPWASPISSFPKGPPQCFS